MSHTPGLPVITSLIPSWMSRWQSHRFRALTAFTVLLLPVSLVSLASFLSAVEHRHGIVIPDPLLAALPAYDLTWLTFGFIYGGIILGVVILAQHPARLLVAFQSYIAMVVFRIIMMSLAPFDPPIGQLPLTDPFVEFFGTGMMLTRDLFFSGHTATLFLLALVMPDRSLKVIYYVCTTIVAACVLLQHVHYSIDVVVAPFVSYGSVRLVTALFWKHEPIEKR